MTRARLDYLGPLFELTDSLVDEPDQEDPSFGLLDEPAEGSQLARDDEGMAGYYVSYTASAAISAALDHAITLKLLVTKAGVVTNSAPWTLLRGILEPASLATWILIGKSRNIRREHTLRVWRHDMTERANWEADTDYVVRPPGKAGRTRAVEILKIASSLGLRQKQVNARFSYSDTVAAAGEAVGWDRKQARGMWRACSGFAHGRAWPHGHLSSVSGAIPVRGGHSFRFVLAEEQHEKVARLTHAVLERALIEYGNGSA